MLTITVPAELVGPLAREASRRGTTSELLALEGIRRLLPTEPPTEANSLLDFLAGYVGTVAGSSEPLSQDCGTRFAEELATGRPAWP